MNGQDCEQLTLFREDFLASRLVLPGSDEAQKMTVTSGLKCLELYKNSSPVGSLARMLLESSTWRSTRCYLTWKISATPAKRLLFRLVPSMPRTGETDALSWPTPTARDYKGSNSMEHLTRESDNRNHRDQLANAVKLWQTPTARNSKGASNTKTRQGGAYLQTAVLVPTPTTGAGLCGGTGNYNQLKALEEAGEITEEERRSMAAGNGGQLNPDWVEALMGFPPGWTVLEPDGATGAGSTESPESPPESPTE